VNQEFSDHLRRAERGAGSRRDRQRPRANFEYTRLDAQADFYERQFISSFDQQSRRRFVAQAVNDANVKGVYADYESERYYPLGSVASQVLGYVGPNASGAGESGHYGIEGFYNNVLKGPPSTDGVGEDINLTIDPNIESEAENIFDNLVTANGATGGSVIVEDPQTGKILAMGATPDFDPNNYGQSPIANFLNPSVQAVYEPGSIFKVLTMAAGIDAGKITSSTTYDDKGYVNVDHAHITNYNLTTYGAYGPGNVDDRGHRAFDQHRRDLRREPDRQCDFHGIHEKVPLGRLDRH
jgi:cell division protein FtsI/penicillin-binding protein 2